MSRSQFYEDKKDVYSRNVDVLRKGGTHRTIIDIVGTGKKILDVGAATGQLGKALKDKGNSVVGIEISSTSARQARLVLDDVIVGDIEEIEIPYGDGYFDVIICADVLEHLFDPVKALAKLKRVLKADGELIAVLPNVAYWQIRLGLLFGRFEYRESGILDEGHIRFYNYRSSRELLEKAGFGIAKVASTMGMNRLIDYVPFFAGAFLFLSGILLRSFPRLFACNFIFVARKR